MAEASPLRQCMIEDMTIRNLSPATQQSYTYAVAKFSGSGTISVHVGWLCALEQLGRILWDENSIIMGPCTEPTGAGDRAGGAKLGCLGQ